MARPPRIRTPAIAYLRTSSAANVGADKGSDKRQRDAIATYAKHAGFAVVETYYDAAVSGADPIETRPGFLALLDRIEGDGVRTVLIEDATRFARELITQELGILSLIKRGVRVLTAAGDDLTATDDPFKKAMRQIAGAFAELEKARLGGQAAPCARPHPQRAGQVRGSQDAHRACRAGEQPRARENPHSGRGDGQAPAPGVA